MSSLSEWTQRMSEQEMPVLAHTAQDITLSSEREDSSSAEIARIILRDSSMTVRVLKLANSSFFNPAGHASRTITRAVVVLGFDVIKSLCLTVALINALIKDSAQQERAMALMAQSFHAATQARGLALACGNRAPEEIYVAALLSRLGEMAFWCFGGEKAHRSADQAAQSARDCGASRLVRFMSSPTLTKPQTAGKEEAPEHDVAQTDPLLQLQILREVATLFEGPINVNLLFNMVLEGIHRGIGMDRTLLAIVAPDRSRIRAKYTLGLGERELMQAFHFPLQGSHQDLFSQIMEVGQPLWFRHTEASAETARLVTPEIAAAIGQTSFFAAPLMAQSRAIGLMYSDRKPSGRNLDEEGFSSFKHFCQQANLGLTLVAKV